MPDPLSVDAGIATRIDQRGAQARCRRCNALTAFIIAGQAVGREDGTVELSYYCHGERFDRVWTRVEVEDLQPEELHRRMMEPVFAVVPTPPARPPGRIFLSYRPDGVDRDLRAAMAVREAREYERSRARQVAVPIGRPPQMSFGSMLETSGNVAEAIEPIASAEREELLELDYGPRREAGEADDDYAAQRAANLEMD